jgi:hypothetical protein
MLTATCVSGNTTSQAISETSQPLAMMLWSHYGPSDCAKASNNLSRPKVAPVVFSLPRKALK